MPPATKQRVRQAISDIEEFGPDDRLSSKVARERKAIVEIVSHLREALDYQHNVIDRTYGTFEPVLRNEPQAADAPDKIGVEFMGSSEMYEQLHSLMNGIVSANRRLEDLNRRAEV